MNTAPTDLPERVAAKVQAGHALEVDPPHALSAVSRWTCGVTMYGGVTERTCEQSLAFWGRG